MKSKHKKLCRQIAHLRGAHFQVRESTTFLIRKTRKSSPSINDLRDFGLLRFCQSHKTRHCEERSDAAIQGPLALSAGLLRCARNDNSRLFTRTRQRGAARCVVAGMIAKDFPKNRQDRSIERLATQFSYRDNDYQPRASSTACVETRDQAAILSRKPL